MKNDHIAQKLTADTVDRRNLVDELKGLSNTEVKGRLAERRNALRVAILNVNHDFNAGTIVRSANNFNVEKVYIIGKKKYNRRGAMCTDKYLEIVHMPDFQDFLALQRADGYRVVAIENNVPGVLPLSEVKFSERTTLVFGGESDGLSEEVLSGVDEVREIESFGSTRSVNVGVAAGIAMYEWVRQCKLTGEKNG